MTTHRCCGQNMDEYVTDPFDSFDYQAISYYCEICDRQIDGGELLWKNAAVYP